MLDTIKNNGPELLTKLMGQFNLTGDQASQVIEVAKDSFIELATDEIRNGNFEGLLSLVNQGSNARDNDLSNKMAAGLTEGIVSKQSFPKNIAGKIKDIVLPFVLDKVMAKTGGMASKADLFGMIGDNAQSIPNGKTDVVLGKSI